MIFYLHFILLTSALSGTSVLLGVYMKYYSDASQLEIGVLLMTFPFLSIIVKPLFCSLADKYQAHRSYLIVSLIIMMIGYSPFVIIPYSSDFHVVHPRMSWYILVISSYIGCSGLAVAWSLGESLAVNSAQRKNIPYSRLRLCGTASWGVYGYIIGEINEVPFLPKFVPAFLSLQLSVFLEIILLLLWNKEDFVMVDCSESNERPANQLENPQDSNKLAAAALSEHNPQLDIDSTPSSLGGTLRLKARTGITIRDYMMADDLNKKLKTLESLNNNVDSNPTKEGIITLDDIRRFDKVTSNHSTLTRKSVIIDCDEVETKPKGSPQILMFKWIMTEDGRLIKYLILFTIFGLLLAPMNFVFLSLDEVCKEKGCNFSHLAGSVLVSQATSETFCFLVLPWILMHISRSTALLFGLFILTLRYFFYAYIYYMPNVSPYWALLGEWGHGIGFGICATILADMALLFANHCRLFIPELRQLGFLSSRTDNGNEAKVLAEEAAMRMALRATMQALFAAGMEGLGIGIGSLVCGVVSEAYSYTKLWQLFMIIAIGTGVIYQLVEVTKCRWSDSFKPPRGTKAFDIRSVERNRKDETSSEQINNKPPADNNCNNQSNQC